jgi:hypothetical protein
MCAFASIEQGIYVVGDLSPARLMPAICNCGNRMLENQRERWDRIDLQKDIGVYIQHAV